jgi:hypothetical protein
VKHLAVGTVCLSIDEAGAALFEPPQETRASIERRVTEYRDFIDQWLEASEGNRPRNIPVEERELRVNLKRLVRGLKPCRFSRDFMETIVREAAKAINRQTPCCSERQITESALDAISSL